MYTALLQALDCSAIVDADNFLASEIAHVMIIQHVRLEEPCEANNVSPVLQRN